MIRKLTLIHMEITLELDYGEKLPYCTLVPVYSFQLEEGDAINCVYPENKTIVEIIPCRVKDEHSSVSFSRSGAHFTTNYMHYILYGKVRF